MPPTLSHRTRKDGHPLFHGLWRGYGLHFLRLMGLAIKLGWLVLFSIYVIRAGADTERKLINFLIIVGSTALGVAGTLVVEYLTDSSQEFALVVGLLSANIGCAIAAAWNYWRAGGIYKGKKVPGNKNDKTVV